MANDLYILLIYKKLKGEITSDESKQLEDFLDASLENREIYADIKLSWELSDQSLRLDQDIDVEADLRKVKAKMSDGVGRVISMRRMLLRVAVIALVVIGGAYLFRQFSSATISETVLAANNKNLPFELPDGTKGILKSGSTLKYDTPFKNNRKIRLDGVAEFDVADDPQHPFTVWANEAIVTVLGTSFVVDHRNEKIKVSVSSGRVSLKQKNQEVILNPGDVGYCKTYQDAPEKRTMSVQNFTYWEKQQFRFDGESIQSIVEQLEFMFNAKIQIANPEMETCSVAGVFNAADPQSILSAIADKFGMKLISSNENIYMLEGGKCN